MSSSPNELIQKVERLKEIITDDVIFYSADIDKEYQTLRWDLINNPSLAKTLPQFIRDYRNLKEFCNWITIELKINLYFLDDPVDKFNATSVLQNLFKDDFDPILNQLELEIARCENSTPLSQSETLKNLDVPTIKNDWEKALNRLLSDDFDGAITTARSMIEGVCKYILWENGISYNDNGQLPELYAQVAKTLNVYPDKKTHHEVLNKICGGCKTVVEEMGRMRTKLGDPHGKSPDDPIASHCHAELAVNLAGSLAIFLLQTWEEIKLEQQQKQFIETDL